MSDNIKILIRADSSSKIGTGHIMRDLVLAEQYPNSQIIFATLDLEGNINHKITEKQYSIEILKTHGLNELIKLIHKHSIDLLIIDHYGIDANFEKSIKQVTGVKIFVLDDTYEAHNCDVLLNHNISADKQKYIGLVPEYCKIKCGANYTLLRNEFIKEKKRGRQNKKPSNNQNIFIAMGGADHSAINLKILNTLETFNNIQINIVTTNANANLDELIIYTNNHPNIKLHINSNKVAKLMNQADLAIVTPSVTINEIIFLNVPFIAIQTTNNQIDIVKYLLSTKKPILLKFNARELEKEVKKSINNKSYTQLLKING